MPRRLGGARQLPPPRLPSDRTLLALRHRVRGGAAAGLSTSRRSPGRRASPAAPPPACSSAGWTARSRSSCTRGSRRRTASPRRCSPRRAPRVHRVCFEGRFGLFASHLQDPALTKDFDRIADDLGHALGQPELVVQAVSGRARAASVHRPGAAPARARTACGPIRWRRSSARSPSSTCRSSASRWRRRRRRPPKRTAACACSTRWPRRWCAASWGATAYADAFRTDPGDPGAGPARHLPGGPVVPAAGPVQGRGDHHADRRPRVFGGRRVQPRLGRESDDRWTSCAPSSTTTRPERARRRGPRAAGRGRRGGRVAGRRGDVDGLDVWGGLKTRGHIRGM